MKKTYLTIKLRTNSDIFESGFSKLLTKEGLLSLTGDENTEILGISSSLGSIINSTSLQNLESGEFIGNLTVRDGYFKSSNYEEGVSGWYLGPEVAQLPATYIIGNLQSSNYDPGVAGWLLEQDTGNLYANDIYARGSITTLSGSSIDAQYLINSTIISTLTMGSALTTGYIQSYGWNGSNNGFQIKGGTSPAITVIGGTITGGIVQTSVSGDRIIMNGSTNKIEFKNGDTLYAQMSPYAAPQGYGFEITTSGEFSSSSSILMYEGISSNAISLYATNINLNGATYLNGTTVNNGNIAPATTNTYSLGTSSYRFSDVHTNAITLNGVQRTSWPTAFSGNLSDLSINTAKNWGGYNITNLGSLIPGSGTTTLGNSSYYWSSMHINEIYGAYGTNPIYMKNNINMNSKDIQYINDLDVNGNCDIEGYVDINHYASIHGLLYMNNQPIRDVANPTNAQDAATKAWVEANFEPKA